MNGAAQERVLARTEPSSFGVDAVKMALVMLVIGVVDAVLGAGWRELLRFFLTFGVLILVIDGVRWWRNLAGVSYAVTSDDLLVRSRRETQTYPLAEILHAEVQGAATWRGMWGGGWLGSFPLLSLVTADGHHTTPRVGIWGREQAEQLQADLDAAVDRARS